MPHCRWRPPGLFSELATLFHQKVVNPDVHRLLVVVNLELDLNRLGSNVFGEADSSAECDFASFQARHE